MRKYLKRLIWKTNNERFTTFLQLGIIHSLLMGLMFTVFSGAAGVRSLPLFTITTELLPHIAGNLWGALLLLVVLGHVCEMLFRGRGIGPFIAMSGFMLWVYAVLAYISLGLFPRALMTCFFPLVYWAWYYVSAIDYKKKLDKGIIDPVD